jgi:hypothetical protein
VNEVGASVGGEELKPGAIVFRENAQPDFTRGERLSTQDVSTNSVDRAARGCAGKNAAASQKNAGSNRMKTVAKYLRHADECEALAKGSTTAEERDMISNMARTWRMLAERRRKMLAMREEEVVAPTKSTKKKSD